jgi:hypothetical protein
MLTGNSRYTRFLSALQKEALTTTSQPTVVPDASNPEVEKFVFEINARADGADAALDGLAKMIWLDGDSNTGNGTSLRFAGNAISGVMYSLDHPRDGVPEFKEMSFPPLLLTDSAPRDTRRCGWMNRSRRTSVLKSSVLASLSTKMWIEN